MSTQNYPHINDDVLKALDDDNLIYLDERDQGCSVVIRLAPSTVNGRRLPLRFEKRSRTINGYVDDQVSHEENIFKAIKDLERKGVYIEKIVNRLEYVQKGEDYVIVTKDTGVDAEKWENIPLFCRNNQRYYQNIFCHPLVLLQFIKSVLIAFENIHKVGLLHCDIKQNQICIPFVKNGDNITPNLHEVRLIDFGVSIWEMVPVVSRNPIRFTSNNMFKGDYVADVLIDAGDYQKRYYEEGKNKQNNRYDFFKIFTQIDCGVDLYSFGFLLKNMAIEIHPDDKEVWSIFYNKFEKWVSELLSLSNKKLPFQNNLPHQRYIREIDQWISATNHILGYNIDDISFKIYNRATSSKPIRRATPTPTPSVAIKKISSPIIQGIKQKSHRTPISVVPKQDSTGSIKDDALNNKDIASTKSKFGIAKGFFAMLCILLVLFLLIALGGNPQESNEVTTLGVINTTANEDLGSIDRNMEITHEDTAHSENARYSDHLGYIWTPDGKYESNEVGALAEFSTTKGEGWVMMGGWCLISGKLTHPDESKPLFLLTINERDGVGCSQDLSEIEIIIVDGYAIHALGNASKIDIRHEATTDRDVANFNGSYKFSSNF